MIDRRKYVRGSIAERLAAHSVPQPNGCIHWDASVNNKGYGQMTINGKRYSTHRASYECARGTLPPGAQVLHRCDNPRCINPEHLFVGDPKANSDDKISKRRQAVGRSLPQTKLTDADVVAIYHARGTQKEIAERFGIVQSQVSRIKHGIRRVHVEKAGDFEDLEHAA